MVTVLVGIDAVVVGNVDWLDVDGRPPVVSAIGGTVVGGVNRFAFLLGQPGLEIVLHGLNFLRGGPSYRGPGPVSHSVY